MSLFERFYRQSRKSVQKKRLNNVSSSSLGADDASSSSSNSNSSEFVKEYLALTSQLIETSVSLRMISVGGGGIAKAGFMKKKSSSMVVGGKYQEEYFVLLGPWLFYFKSDNPKAMSCGVIPMLKAKAHGPPLENNNNSSNNNNNNNATTKYNFSVETLTHTYRFKVANGTDYIEWLQAMRHSASAHGYDQQHLDAIERAMISSKIFNFSSGGALKATTLMSKEPEECVQIPLASLRELVQYNELFKKIQRYTFLAEEFRFSNTCAGNLLVNTKPMYCIIVNTFLLIFKSREWDSECQEIVPLAMSKIEQAGDALRSSQITITSLLTQLQYQIDIPVSDSKASRWSEAFVRSASPTALSLVVNDSDGAIEARFTDANYVTRIMKQRKAADALQEARGDASVQVEDTIQQYAGHLAPNGLPWGRSVDNTKRPLLELVMQSFYRIVFARRQQPPVLPTSSSSSSSGTSPSQLGGGGGGVMGFFDSNGSSRSQAGGDNRGAFQYASQFTSDDFIYAQAYLPYYLPDWPMKLKKTQQQKQGGDERNNSAGATATAPPVVADAVEVVYPHHANKDYFFLLGIILLINGKPVINPHINDPNLPNVFYSFRDKIYTEYRIDLLPTREDYYAMPTQTQRNIVDLFCAALSGLAPDTTYHISVQLVFHDVLEKYTSSPPIAFGDFTLYMKRDARLFERYDRSLPRDAPAWLADTNRMRLRDSIALHVRVLLLSKWNAEVLKVWLESPDWQEFEEEVISDSGFGKTNQLVRHKYRALAAWVASAMPYDGFGEEKVIIERIILGAPATSTPDRMLNIESIYLHSKTNQLYTCPKRLVVPPTTAASSSSMLPPIPSITTIPTTATNGSGSIRSLYPSPMTMGDVSPSLSSSASMLPPIPTTTTTTTAYTPGLQGLPYPSISSSNNNSNNTFGL